MTRSVTFTVAGVPATAGSKRGFPIYRRDGSVGVGMAPANERQKPWMAAVAAAAAEASEGELFTGPVMLKVQLLFVRPKGHYRSDGVRLRPNAPMYHVTKPDGLKCVRAIEDALKGVLWRDDSQVVCHLIEKFYVAPGEHAGAQVTVSELDAPGQQLADVPRVTACRP